MLLQKELGVIENSYYEHSVQRRAASPVLTDEKHADVCVVGGGYAGLSAALELAERGYDVVLLEAQRLGWGASGRNGGQVLVGFGSEGEHAIEKQLSPADSLRAWDVSVAGLDLLHSRIEKYKIDCDYVAGTLSLAVKQSKMHELDAWANRVTNHYHYPMRRIAPTEIRQWIGSNRYYGGIFDGRSGHLHPLKYCLGLADATSAAGVHIYENSPVLVLERGNKAVLKTAQGQVSADFVVLAGNVYLAEYGDLAPEVSSRIMPVGTYIVATEQLSPEMAVELLPRRSAVSDTNFVLDYFRLSADSRLLFGGGDAYSGRTPRNVQQGMRQRMLQVFPQLGNTKIEYSWGGFVDLSLNRSPDFGRLGSNIYFLQGFSGHGLAMAGMAGKIAADAIAGQSEKFDLFAKIKHQRFPGGKYLRTPAMVLGMTYFKLLDYLA